jgi:hypothetical protein
MLHNIDTLGASLDARWLGRHITSGAGADSEDNCFILHDSARIAETNLATPCRT